MNPDDTIDILNKLIETCKDGEYGFETSAEHLRDRPIKQEFLNRAAECASAARELQRLVVKLGGKPEDSGSASGAAHRGWVAVKAVLTGYSDARVLEDAERGEDQAMERYRAALAAVLPPDIRVIVEKQFEGVKRNHARVHELRDLAKAAKV